MRSIYRPFCFLNPPGFSQAGVIRYWLFVNRKWLKIIYRTHLKNVDKGSWQGADRRKSGAYTIVCEHFEPGRNTAMST